MPATGGHRLRVRLEDREHLVELLLACPCVRDRGARDSALIPDLDADFKRELGIRLDFARNDRDSIDVSNLVRECLDHHRGVELLARVVGAFDGGTLAFAELERFLQLLFVPGVVASAAVDRLLASIPEGLVPDSAARRLYYRSVGRFGPPLEGERDLHEVVRQLAGLNLQVGGTFPYPLLAFVERLARQVEDAGVRTQLQQWVDTASGDLGIEPALYRRLQREATEQVPGGDERPYLLVQLKPSALNHEVDEPERLQLYVQAWLVDERGELDLRFNQDEVSTIEGGTVEAVGSALDQWLERVTDLIPEAMSRLVFEFFLPRELLCYPVDQWSIVADDQIGMEIKLGEQFPVVVREVDRLGNRKARHHWRRKWEHAQAFGSCPGCGAMHWVDDTQVLDRKRFYLELLHAEHRTCVGLPYLPPDAPERRDLLLVTLSAGIPIALWLRRRIEDMGQLRRDVDAELTRAGLTRLPEFVLRQRVEAGSEDHHAGSHLALLWDNPDRLPPVPPELSAPEP
jgi:hypothetical protein